MSARLQTRPDGGALAQGSAITTRIGSLGFELISALRAPFSVIPANPICSVQGDVVASVWEAEACYLLIDHRVDPSPGRMSRVELWHPSEGGEAPLAGLFVADTYTPVSATGETTSLAALAAAILSA